MALTTVRSTGIGSLPAISGANLTSLNASNISSGTLNSARFSGGKIAQIVEDSETGHSTINSTTYADVSLQATITPSASTSKVLVMANLNGIKINSSSGGNVQIRIQHDQGGSSFTNLAEYEEVLAYNDNDVNNFSPMYLHSPSTTNAIIYKVQAALLNGFSSGSARINNRNADGGYIRSSLILMEVLA